MLHVMHCGIDQQMVPWMELLKVQQWHWHFFGILHEGLSHAPADTHQNQSIDAQGQRQCVIEFICRWCDDVDGWKRCIETAVRLLVSQPYIPVSFIPHTLHRSRRLSGPILPEYSMLL